MNARPISQAAEEQAIDEMLAEPDCFDTWLDCCPPSVAGLLSLILSRGLPRNNDTDSDGELCELFQTRIDSVQEDFTEWAYQPTRFKSAPVYAWIQESQR